MPFEESFEDEIRRLEEQFQQQPESLVFARLADAHRKAGNPHRALEVLEEGIRRHSDYLSAHIVRARTYLDLERVEDARAAFERVIEIDAQNLVALRGLAGIARDEDLPHEEIQWLTRLAQADPQNPEPEGRLGELRRRVQSEGAPREVPGGDATREEVEETDLPPLEDTWWSAPPPAEPGLSDAAIAESSDLGSELWSGPALSADSETGFPPESLSDAATAPAEEGRDEAAAAAPVSQGAWWFEPPAAGDEDRAAGQDAEDEDADLLTRTMAELYARQGLFDQAEAIYRELLQDRPGDEGLRAGLDAVLGMKAARGAKSQIAATAGTDQVLAAPDDPEEEIVEAPEEEEREPEAAMDDTLHDLLRTGEAPAQGTPEPPPQPEAEGKAEERDSRPAADTPRPAERHPSERPFVAEWLRGLRS